MNDDNIKNLSYVLTNKVLTVGLHGVFWIVIASLLKPESFGEFSFLIALVSMAVLIANFGATQSIVVFQAKKII